MRCKIGINLAMVVALSLMSAGAAFADVNMQEGLWEISGEMKIEGLPFPMPPVPMKFNQCLTKKDMVPVKKEKNQECKTSSTKIEGSTVSWTVQCKDKSGVVTDSNGSATYKGNMFDSTAHTVTTDAKGAKSQSSMKMSGKRTGDCK
jgi:hypothetical protein